MTDYIFYTGTGAKKSGKHTIDEFLRIMNKHYNISCSHYLTGLEYEPCIEQKKMNKDFYKKLQKNNAYKRNKKTEKKYNNIMKKCQKRKITYKNRSCNLNEYITFSGAEKK